MGRPLALWEKAGELQVFADVPQLSLQWRAAARPRESVNGDGAACCRGQEGTLLLLSDGMGCGAAAAARSRETLRLVADLAGAGVPAERGIPLANRLVADRGEEGFATLDGALLSGSGGALTFFKCGAPPSFLVQGEEVTAVCGRSLPVGILADAQPTVCRLPAAAGDVLVLITDGVEEALGPETLRSRIAALCAQSRDPEILSRELLRQAVAAGEGEPADDMTVVAALVARGA